jgi:[ribosomal protein S18]-alanine N-acetyltransferase
MFRLDEMCFEPRFRFSRAVMRRFAETPGAIVVAAEAGSELAGFCIVHLAGAVDGREAYVVTLDVAPEHRREGIATKLMEWVEDEAAESACSAMTLHVHTANTAAIQFYERVGYQLSNRAEHFYGPSVHALVYRKPLPLIEEQQIA